MTPDVARPAAPSPVVGLVLAGGRSSRMGRDKAALELDGRPLAGWVAAALRAAGVREVLLGGGDPALAARIGATHVPDAVPGRGPLAGLAAVMGRTDGIVVVVPCDVPGVTGGDLRALVDAVAGAEPGEGADVACVGVAGRREPLVSAWVASRCRAVVDDVLASDDHSVRAALARLDVVEVGVGDPSTLVNVNTPADLRRLRAARSRQAGEDRAGRSSGTTVDPS